MLAAGLARLPESRACVVAYSGGLDSTVLLHALRQRAGVRAVHVNHGIHPAAPQWVAHCAAQAAAWGVDCQVATLRASPPRANLESWAREHRYAALRRRLEPGDLLLTAHHADDQAETLLLALLRGSGLDGLAGLAQQRAMGCGQLWRPLLGVSRAEILQYAQQNQLKWIEDSSNGDLRFDRNFLRAEVLPKLSQRWPQAAANLTRSANLLAQARSAQERGLGRFLPVFSVGEALSVPLLAACEPALRADLLRHYLRRRGLILPPARVLAELPNLLRARADREPRLSWPGAELRRYREQLWAMAPLAAAPDTACEWNPATVLNWAGTGRLTMLQGAAELSREQPVLVAPPAGGEVLRPLGAARRRSLKNLCQEAGLPPWVRRRLPLIWQAGKLLAVGDLWISADLPGLRLHWERNIVGLERV